jgi:hypothetical protein
VTRANQRHATFEARCLDFARHDNAPEHRAAGAFRRAFSGKNDESRWGRWSIFPGDLYERGAGFARNPKDLLKNKMLQLCRMAGFGA